MLIERLATKGLHVLPPEGERLWTLNAVRVPEGVNDAAVRAHLLEQSNIEIGAGLGPLAGKIWRVGLMGESSDARYIALLEQGLENAFASQRPPASA
jgi:alanine-glyoxylate transaminase/serine-glyoxylate transaminase/serine-pyruvate transaminase